MLPSVPSHWYAISDQKRSFKGADVYCDETYDGATAATVRSQANQIDLTAAARSFYGSNVAYWLAYAIEAGGFGCTECSQLGKRALHTCMCRLSRSQPGQVQMCQSCPAPCPDRADSPANHQAGKTYFRNFHFWASGMVRRACRAGVC